MKKILLISILMGACIAKAQQIPLYNEYYINPFVYNPSLTGVSGNSNVYLIHRNQWQDFPGAPVTSALTFDMPIQKDKIGLGFIVSSDQTGIVTRTEAMASMSYRARDSPQQSILFGLAGGILDNRIDFNSIIAHSPNEASLYAQTERRTGPNATFGVTYQFNRLELGVSVPQLFADKLPYISQIDARTYYTLVRHYMGSIKYTIDIDKQREIKAYPLVLVRTAAGNVPVETDVSGVVSWANVGWAAISYRSNLSMAFNAGIQYKGIVLGYVYEIPVSSISGYAGSSNELLLGYTFGKTRNGKGHDMNGEDENWDLLVKKVESIDKRTGEIKNRMDTLEDRVNGLEFDRVNSLKRELKVGDLLVLKNVNFEFNSYQLTNRSYETLDELLVLLNNVPSLKIAIYGHTDEVGAADYNDKLSEKRAKAVYEYLVEGGGISAERLSYKGFGARKPLIQGAGKHARSRNRRVEFKVIAK